MQTAKTLIRSGGCPGWSESSLGAHAILLVLSWGGSFIKDKKSDLPTHTKSKKPTVPYSTIQHQWWWYACLELYSTEVLLKHQFWAYWEIMAVGECSETFLLISHVLWSLMLRLPGKNIIILYNRNHIFFMHKHLLGLKKVVGTRSHAILAYFYAQFLWNSCWICMKIIKNAAIWQNQLTDLCTQWRLRSAMASAQSDQSLRCALNG